MNKLGLISCDQRHPCRLRDPANPGADHDGRGGEAPVIAGTTGDQRFYLGWAQVWRRNYREANLHQRLITDPRSLSEQRVAVVRSMDPWYQAFGAQPGPDPVSHARGKGPRVVSGGRP